jgi:hypothetical protein
MHLLSAAVISLTSLTGLSAAHGLVTKPAARTPGKATAAVCGAKLVAFYNADNTSYPEAFKRANPAGFGDDYNAAKCNQYLCKGFQFDDNKDHVQTYKTGQTVDMEVFIRIPHKGYANVSVVDLAANKVIGEPLKVWADNYAASLNNNPKDQTSFSVKVPELSGKCATAGQCVSYRPGLHFRVG